MGKFYEYFWNREDDRLHVIWRLFIFTLFFIGMGLIDLFVLKKLGLELILDIKIQLFILLVVSSFFDKRKIEDYGFKMNMLWLLEFFFGCLIGFFFVSIIFIIAYFAKWVTISSFFHNDKGKPIAGELIQDFYLLVFQSFLLIFAYSGYILRNVAEGIENRIGAPKALVFGSFISAIYQVLYNILLSYLHSKTIESLSWIGSINVFIKGLVTSIFYIYTGSLSFLVGFDLLYNFSMGYIYGFANKAFLQNICIICLGSSSTSSSYISYLLGSFTYGPEGGFLSTILYVLILLIIFAYLKLKARFTKQDKIKLQEYLAEYKPFGGTGVINYNKLPDLDMGENYDTKDEWKL